MDFKVFDPNKKSKFLAKTKENKSKREEENKKMQAITILQKNIRAFLDVIRNDSNILCMRARSKQSIHHIQTLWQDIASQPNLLKKKFSLMILNWLMTDEQINIDMNSLISVILEFSSSNIYSFHQYLWLIRMHGSKIHQNQIKQFIHNPAFNQALKAYIHQSIHTFIDFIIRQEDVKFINCIIEIYFSPFSVNMIKMDIEEQETEERVLKSFYNGLAIFKFITSRNQDDNGIIKIISILVSKIKAVYTNLILRKYNIDKKMYESPSFRQEIEQVFRQKKQWEEYENHLSLLRDIMPMIIEKYISNEALSILESATNLLICYTELGQSNINFQITKQQFFTLIQKLQSQSYFNKEQQTTKYQQLLIVILLLEKYLENTNDLKFIHTFKYDATTLKRSIKDYLMKFMRNMINFNTQFAVVQEVVKHAVSFLNNLYNKIFRTNILKTSVFQDASIQIMSSNYGFAHYGNSAYMKEILQIVERAPFLLPIQTRFLVFKNKISSDRNNLYGQYYDNKTIEVHRGRQFQDAFDQLYRCSLKSRLRIRFINSLDQQQVGIDAGGLTKQFLTRVFKKAFNPKFGRFVQNQKKQLIPNPDFEKIQQGRIAKQYQFIGRLLGKSLCENIMLGIKFAGPFLNLLINKRNTFDDLLQIDPDLYKSLVYIAQMEQGVEDLELNFQYQDNINKNIINLKPRGDKIKVTSSNKMQYINLLVNYKVNRSFERQTRHIRKGLRSMIDQNWIRMFNYAELNYLLSGAENIDVRDWMDHTKVVGNNCQQLIKNFWNIVFEFTQQQKSLLLKFVTSCQRPSFLGFQDLSPPFTIRVIQHSKDILPVSHTCSNALDLPQYSSYEAMKSKILYAIKSETGFQIG